MTSNYNYKSTRLRGILIGGMIAALSFSTYSATGLIDVGVGGGMRYFIDSGTIKHDSPGLRYRLVGHGAFPGMQVSFTGEVGVNCELRTRIEYLSTTSTVDGRTTTTSASGPEPRPVYEGTRQAQELTVACNIANGSLGQPNVPSESKPLPPPVQIAIPAPPKRVADKPKSSGTGFVISTDGTIATNFHVVEDCSAVKGFIDGRLHDSTVVATDEANDLALLRIASTRIPAISLAVGQPELGSAITILGYPLTGVLGTDLKATTGIISSLSGVRGERRNMQISAAVQPGNSGGPVLDDRGAIVGMVVAKLSGKFAAENVNFAIRGPLLRSFLEINGIEVVNSKQNRALSVSEIVKKAAPSTVLLYCF